ncbi:MAG: type IV secretory system conjugative DNA transfer family protein [Clostridia bacterium]|nr:type IV secretory system conjugative DNA transfer family protein [Clostridia bacterium]
MKRNVKLLEKYAKGVPGEQTELIDAEKLISENEFTVHKALSPHSTGMPVTSYRNADGELCIIQRDGLCHALVAGSTGCGKSMRYLETCLFDLDGTASAIVADVKGELYRNTAEYLRGIYGKENVKYMDFIHPERSQILFNPIADIARKYLEAELHPERTRSIRNEALAELKILFDKLFPVRSPKDASWDEGARGFIYGIVAGLFEDMLLNKEDEKKTGRRRILPEQINFETISEIFFRFENRNNEFNDFGFFDSREKDSIVWRYVRGIMHDAPNTRACYLQLVESYLCDYSYPDIRTLTIADNFDVSSLGDRPQVIFLTYDITDTRMRGFVNQYIVKALDTLKKKAIDAGTPLNVPVQFFLDEFPTLQADDIYPTIFSVGRGLNLYITAIVQDYTQLETSYNGGVAQQIRNNCNLTFFLGTNDINTAKAVKEQIGRHIVPDPATYLQGDVKFIESYVVSEDELMHRVRPGDAYITINNHMPVKGFFELYFNCPEYTRFPKSTGIGQPVIDFDSKKYHYDASWIKKKSWSPFDD